MTIVAMPRSIEEPCLNSFGIASGSNRTQAQALGPGPREVHGELRAPLVGSPSIPSGFHEISFLTYIDYGY